MNCAETEQLFVCLTKITGQVPTMSYLKDISVTLCLF